jgi:hypothetical protein
MQTEADDARYRHSIGIAGARCDVVAFFWNRSIDKFPPETRLGASSYAEVMGKRSLNALRHDGAHTRIRNFGKRSGRATHCNPKIRGSDATGITTESVVWLVPCFMVMAFTF